MTAPFRQVVAAYDASPQAEDALDRAVEMARSWSIPLVLVAVFERPSLLVLGPALPIPPDPLGDEQQKALGAALQRAVDQARSRGASEVRGVLREGHPSEEILRFLEGEHADLVVMGSRGRSPVGRLLLGSVSDAVVHHARCAVLIVRPLA